MPYHTDLQKISLGEYRTKLKSAYLPPSRKVLRESMEERFDFFQSHGINNLKELLEALKKKERFAEWSKAPCFEGNYLTILLRELNSMLPKPNAIADFPGISKDCTEKLALRGIRNTRQLYERVKTPADRKLLSELAGVGEAELLELTMLSDLSRIKWVGPAFARMLYDVGANTAEKAGSANPVDLHRKINDYNKERNIYKGTIGLNDIGIFVDAAKEVALEIEY